MDMSSFWFRKTERGLHVRLMVPTVITYKKLASKILQSQNNHSVQYRAKWKDALCYNSNVKLNLESNVIQGKISVDISLLFNPFYLWCIKIMAAKKKSVYCTSFIAPIACWNFSNIYPKWNINDCPENKILFLKLTTNYAAIMRQKGRNC